jgi:thiosulfate dehydrogenase (quinone) large subunit
MHILKFVTPRVTTQIKEEKMNVVRSSSPKVATQIPEAPIARFLFADTRMAWFWLLVRLSVGMGWLAAGVSKVTGYAFGLRPNGPPLWFMANNGAALKVFANMAIAHGGAQSVPGFPDWFVGAPDWYASFLHSIVVPNAGVFSYLVACGEILVGLGLIFGCFAGIAAVFGLLLNINFMLSGVMDPNLVTGAETLFLILAWRIAGYYGVDRWLLPRLGTPWTGSLTHRKTPEALTPLSIVP